MARITVEDCLVQENNRFALVLLSSQRTKQILTGSKTLVNGDNKAVVMSLREIAHGDVRFMSAQEAQEAELREREEAEKLRAMPPVFEAPPPPAPESNGKNGSDDEE